MRPSQQPPLRAAVDLLRPVWAIVRLLRPLNVVMFVGGTLVGVLMAGGGASLAHADTWWAALSVATIGAGANALNDAFDVQIDRVNRPDRPIPAGLVSVQTARWTWGILSAVGLGIAWHLSATHALIAGGSFGLLVAYSARLKRIPVAGNAAIALVVGLLALVYGGLTGGSMTAALPGMLFAVLTTLSRELAKDAEDVAGDLADGARTLAGIIGAELTCRWAILPAAVALVLAPTPYIFLDYPGLYLLVLLPTGLALTAAIARLAIGDAAAASTALKTAMVTGLMALAAASV